MTGPLAASASVAAVLRDAGERLQAAGIDTPRLDAELLLAEVLAVSRPELVLRSSEVLEPLALERFESLVKRRVAREPVAYILGRKPFRHIELVVDSRVLIPRPETELLVEVGLELPEGAQVLDIGTGSGAVALALKHERPDLRVTGTDISRGAIEVARHNAQRLGLDVLFLHADLLGGEVTIQNADAVLANLPYVAAGTDELEPEIALYEPAGALFAGADGLGVIRRLVRQAEGVDLIGLEVGFDQAAAVSSLLVAAGYREVERRADLAGHERVIVGRR